MKTKAQTKQKDQKRFHTPKELAILLDVTPQTIINWSKDGKIPCINVERVFRYDLEDVGKTLGYDLAKFLN
jgi:predicted site-specific integrase-resolvase